MLTAIGRHLSTLGKKTEDNQCPCHFLLTLRPSFLTMTYVRTEALLFYLARRACQEKHVTHLELRPLRTFSEIGDWEEKVLECSFFLFF